MKTLEASAGAAAVAFAATNIDDFCVLILYFARVKTKEMKIIHVILGQCFGFSIICALSLLGILIGVFVPPGYVGLVGFLPLLLGVWRLIGLIRTECIPWVKEKRKQKIESPKTLENTIAVLDDPSEGVMLVIKSKQEKTIAEESPTSNEITENSHMNNNAKEQEQQPQDSPVESSKLKTFFGRICSPFIFEIMLVTLANGGDNVSVYLPLFASANATVIVTTLAIFYCLLAAWLLISFLFIQCPIVAELFSKYGEYIVPFVLIGLGLFILSDTVLFGPVE